MDVAEIHAPYASQEIIVRRPSAWTTPWSSTRRAGRWPPTGDVGRAHPYGEAAGRVRRAGPPRRGHATSGPCLQQNLVCVLEGE